MGADPTIVCHRGSDALSSASPAWEALLRANPAAPIFARPAWANIWLRVYGRGRPVRVLEVGHGGRPIGLLPLLLTRVAGVGLRRLEFIGASPTTRQQWLLSPNGHGLAYYNDALIAPDAGDVAIPALCRWLKANSDQWDDLRLTSVPEGSALATRFVEVMTSYWHPAHSIERMSRTVDTSMGWDAVRAVLSKRQARHLRYEPQALGRAAGGELSLEEVRGPDTVTAMEDFLLLHGRRWAADRRPGLSRQEAAVYRSLAALRDAHFVVYRLVSNSTLLATQFGFDFGEIYIPYNFAHNPDFGRQSPANVLLQMVIAHCCERGIREVDLIGLRNSERWARVEHSRVHLSARRPGAWVGVRAAIHHTAGTSLEHIQESSTGRRTRSALAKIASTARQHP